MSELTLPTLELVLQKTTGLDSFNADLPPSNPVTGFGCIPVQMQLGGSLSVESDGVGLGATFMVRLPIQNQLSNRISVSLSMVVIHQMEWMPPSNRFNSIQFEARFRRNCRFLVSWFILGKRSVFFFIATREGQGSNHNIFVSNFIQTQHICLRTQHGLTILLEGNYQV